jgi:hypothetical protein
MVINDYAVPGKGEKMAVDVSIESKYGNERDHKTGRRRL